MRTPYNAAMLRILFVCGRGRMRSRTAADLYRTDPRVAVRHGGVGAASDRRVSADDLAWADLVLVMEPEHKRRLMERAGRARDLPPIRVLDVPDDYEHMDPELVDLLRTAIDVELDALG